MDHLATSTCVEILKLVQVLPFVFYTLEEWDWTGQPCIFLKMKNENCLVDNVPLSCLVHLSGYIQLVNAPSLTPSQLLHLDDLIRTHHLTMTEVIPISLVYIQCNYISEMKYLTWDVSAKSWDMPRCLSMSWVILTHLS